jgi:outer membrane protein assembly factor BamB
LVKNPAGKTELVLAIQGKILGFDPATGKALWNCDTDIGWYMVPSLVADDQGVVYVIGGRAGAIRGLCVKTGGSGDVTGTHRLWTMGKGSNVTSPVLYEGHLYWMEENQGIAYCANAKTGDIVYEERVPRADQYYPSPVLADGKLYYFTRNGKCFIIEAQPEYKLLGTNTIEERGMINSSPALGDGRLFIRTNKALYAIGKK